MAFTVSVGEADFAALRREKAYYVDKNELTYDTLHSSEDNLWSVLLMTGYITKADTDECGDTVRLKIPNKEISSIFEDTVVRLFNETVDRNEQKNMMDAFWRGDAGEAGRILSDLLWKTISYNDYHEDYYHAFSCRSLRWDRLRSRIQQGEGSRKA